MTEAGVAPRFHTLTVTQEGLELAQLKDLIRNVEDDLATLKTELAKREDADSRGLAKLSS